MRYLKFVILVSLFSCRPPDMSDSVVAGEKNQDATVNLDIDKSLESAAKEADREIDNAPMTSAKATEIVREFCDSNGMDGSVSKNLMSQYYAMLMKQVTVDWKVSMRHMMIKSDNIALVKNKIHDTKDFPNDKLIKKVDEVEGSAHSVFEKKDLTPFKDITVYANQDFDVEASCEREPSRLQTAVLKYHGGFLAGPAWVRVFTDGTRKTISSGRAGYMAPSVQGQANYQSLTCDVAGKPNYRYIKSEPFLTPSGANRVPVCARVEIPCGPNAGYFPVENDKVVKEKRITSEQFAKRGSARYYIAYQNVRKLSTALPNVADLYKKDKNDSRIWVEYTDKNLPVYQGGIVDEALLNKDVPANCAPASAGTSTTSSSDSLVNPGQYNGKNQEK